MAMSKPEQIGRDRRIVNVPSWVKRVSSRLLRRKARQAKDLEALPKRREYGGWFA